MEWLAAPDYDIARLILQRGLATVYLLAFLNVHNQFRPLLGENGLLPTPYFLAQVGYRQAPSLFHWSYSDWLLGGVAWTGMVLALGAMLGVTDLVPLGVSIVWWLMLWALYLSIVNVGQSFYSFGWESLLLEAGFYAAFLAGPDVAPPLLVLFLFRWLVFRVEFGAGMIKMRGDRCWRDLTCLDYHHETQPMPNPLSSWFHRRPRWFHRIEVGANHITQLVIPFALFLPQPAAGVGGVAIIASQAYLMVSGNYAWLNFVTLILGFAAIPDAWFGVLATGIGGGEQIPVWFGVVVIALAGAVAVLSYRPARNLVTGRQLMNYAFNRYHLVNTYGAFGSVTRHRREVIVEASASADPAEADWRPYEFKGKPGEPAQRPPQWAPYHLRLDWLLWFVALSPRYGQGWLEALVEKLLVADPPTLGLLRSVPFGQSRPAAVRARLVDYRFATSEERRDTGAVWVQGDSRLLFAPVRQSHTG